MFMRRPWDSILGCFMGGLENPPPQTSPETPGGFVKVRIQRFGRVSAGKKEQFSSQTCFATFQSAPQCDRNGGRARPGGLVWRPAKFVDGGGREAPW